MPYIVKTSAAKMPSKCWGTYRRVAVIELLPGFTSCAMISERSRGVVRIVELWDRLNVGKTGRCAYSRALAAANALVISLMASAMVEEDATSDL